MEFRDPVHGPIHLLDQEIPIVQHGLFQRLRSVKQLGLAECAFPGATHTRFLHSLGVMHTGLRAFQTLFQHHPPSPDLSRLKEAFKLACLLHDIGHAPLSHTTEMAMPPVSSLALPPSLISPEEERRATHEDYTTKILLESSLGDSFKKVEGKWGPLRSFIVDLILGVSSNKAFFTLEGVNYFPLLHQLISSELDCDRMDYLRRDSYFCGVSYGLFDLDWMIDNLSIAVEDNQAFLALNERALVTFEDFLLSRYHMFVMVYFHHRAVCFEKILEKYFKSPGCLYKIPSDIEEYREHDDHLLMKVLRSDQGTYARQIVENKIPPLIYESFNHRARENLPRIIEFLKEEGIDHIQSSSLGRLSRYSQEGELPRHTYPLKVVHSYKGKKDSFSNIGEETDLFKKIQQIP